MTAPLAPNPRDINALFQVEAENRPSGAPRAEDVIAALQRGGVNASEVRQHLARPYGARYCLGAVAADCALSVCEYIDSAAAEAGAAASRKIPLGHREVQVHGKLSLTVREIKASNAADALSARAFELFRSL